ncbi:MAG TPA: hypothetical protein VFR90_12470 [Methylibium sp.]|uniref:hypothetical protein n=1 Tax=Methylibium sp. TaxID=2067992 RepID=UPI002DB5A16E|nr:hypothetical protein [Methylibium sp.]HEU4459928.1 hypothetical protein [Methylibium sp.]
MAVLGRVVMVLVTVVLSDMNLLLDHLRVCGSMLRAATDHGDASHCLEGQQGHHQPDQRQTPHANHELTLLASRQTLQVAGLDDADDD